MDTEPIRAASVGLGRWADVIARAAARSHFVRIVSCYSHTPEKRAAFSGRFGCQEASSYEELLADDSIEAVLVTTPNTEHARTIEQAVAAGKHVWVEKPIAHTLADARRIAASVARAGITLAVGHSARLLGASRKMKALVDRGEVGKVTLVEANWSNERALELTPDMWRYHATDTPGGPLIQLLIHHFDTAQYIFGPITEVQAYKGRFYTSAEVDDAAVVIARFDSGLLSYFGSSWVSPGIYWINLYGTKANLYHELDFGRWTDPDVDRYATLFRHDHGSSDRVRVEIPTSDMFPNELDDFARAVRSGRPPEVGVAEAMRALAVVDAAIRSAELGRPVAVADVMG